MQVRNNQKGLPRNRYRGGVSI